MHGRPVVHLGGTGRAVDLERLAMAYRERPICGCGHVLLAIPQFDGETIHLWCANEGALARVVKLGMTGCDD
jgi:hypothetical protein